MTEEAKEVTPSPTRGVPIVLDRERHLRFSLKTMREMREKFGPDGLKAGFNQDKIAELLWYGLRGEDPGLTVEDVEELVDLETLKDVMEAVSLATGTHGYVEVAAEEELEEKTEEKAEEKEDAKDPSAAPAPTSTSEPETQGSGKDAPSPEQKPVLSKAS